MNICQSRPAFVLLLLIFAAAALPDMAVAKKQPKTYPEEGKVTASTVNEVPYRRTASGANGTTYPVHGIHRTRVYTVETASRIFDLDCGKTPSLFSSTPGECGGDKKIQLGDTIHFRLEKGWAYIPAPEAAYPAQEERLRVLKEEMKTDAKPAEGVPSAAPKQPDTNPPG